MTEFELIQEYFNTQLEHRADVIQSIGDDAAVVKVPADHELVITTDTLINNVHFPESTKPYDIGYKALAVNLSDLAAMGATPTWVTLALTLPNADENWLQEFCAGFFTLANRYQVQLIGGDLTRGPLSITIQALGLVPKDQAILRSNAKPGDLIYVTGTLGDAAAGLAFLQQTIPTPSSKPFSLLRRLNQPEPRIQIGIALRNLATSAIDISDGLSADLGHILKQSQVGAKINLDLLPLSDELKHLFTKEQAIECALTGGDDYELCFTIPTEKHEELEKKLASIPCSFTHIGTITQNQSLDLSYANENKYKGPKDGYQHF